jgi:hypothetical protein
VAGFRRRRRLGAIRPARVRPPRRADVDGVAVSGIPDGDRPADPAALPEG